MAILVRVHVVVATPRIAKEIWSRSMSNVAKYVAGALERAIILVPNAATMGQIVDYVIPSVR